MPTESVSAQLFTLSRSLMCHACLKSPCDHTEGVVKAAYEAGYREVLDAINAALGGVGEEEAMEVTRRAKGWAERTELLQIGQMMANWAFNMSQSKELSVQRRHELASLYHDWDAASEKFRAIFRKKAKALGVRDER